ncbi:MAG: hypothetical protein ACKV0T_27015 [Planctomycetales bacterium]
METSLHRQLKEFYCGNAAAHEVRVGEFRIDAIVEGQLIEIQQAALGALKRKVPELLQQHEVVVVKPLAAHKTIVRRDRAGGPMISRRVSPRHETLLDLFQELVSFVDVFPHPRLTVEVLLTEQEEERIKIRRRKRWAKDYRIADRRLVGVFSRHVLRTAADLQGLLPGDTPETFTTADVARLARIPRWLAQKMLYCLRQTGGVVACGKQGRSSAYRRTQLTRDAA